MGIKPDIARIARNTGFRESDIAKVKNYVFMEYHYLGYKAGILGNLIAEMKA